MSERIAGAKRQVEKILWAVAFCMNVVTLSLHSQTKTRYHVERQKGIREKRQDDRGRIKSMSVSEDGQRGEKERDKRKGEGKWRLE